MILIRMVFQFVDDDDDYCELLVVECRKNEKTPTLMTKKKE